MIEPGDKQPVGRPRSGVEQARRKGQAFHAGIVTQGMSSADFIPRRSSRDRRRARPRDSAPAHRTHRPVQGAGRLLMGLSLEVTEHDRQAIFRGKAVQLAMESRVGVDVDSLFRDRLGRPIELIGKASRDFWPWSIVPGGRPARRPGRARAPGNPRFAATSPCERGPGTSPERRRPRREPGGGAGGTRPRPRVRGDPAGLGRPAPCPRVVREPGSPGAGNRRGQPPNPRTGSGRSVSAPSRSVEAPSRIHPRRSHDPAVTSSG